MFFFKKKEKLETLLFLSSIKIKNKKKKLKKNWKKLSCHAIEYIWAS